MAFEEFIRGRMGETSLLEAVEPDGHGSCWYCSGFVMRPGLARSKLFPQLLHDAVESWLALATQTQSTEVHLAAQASSREGAALLGRCGLDHSTKFSGDCLPIFGRSIPVLEDSEATRRSVWASLGGIATLNSVRHLRNRTPHRDFVCVIDLFDDSALERAVNLPGYSHASVGVREVRYYPFTEHIRRVHFRALDEPSARAACEGVGLPSCSYIYPWEGESVSARKQRLKKVCETVVADNVWWQPAVASAQKLTRQNRPRL